MHVFYTHSIHGLNCCIIAMLNWFALWPCCVCYVCAYIHCHAYMHRKLMWPLSFSLPPFLSLAFSLPPSISPSPSTSIFFSRFLSLSPSLPLWEAVAHSSGLWGSDPGVGGGNGLWLNELCLSLKRPPITKGGWTSYGDSSRAVRWRSLATASRNSCLCMNLFVQHTRCINY